MPLFGPIVLEFLVAGVADNITRLPKPATAERERERKRELSFGRQSVWVTHVAVAQKHEPKWHLGKCHQRPTPA